MDKSWIYEHRLSTAFEKGVEDFLKFAQANAENRNSIRCPCTQCGNSEIKSLRQIKNHLFLFGFEETYDTWVWHGENPPRVGSPSMNTNEGVDRDANMDAAEDAEETIEMVQAAQDRYSKEPEKLCELLEDAEKPLYKGCKKFTKLSAVVQLFNLKAKYGWSDRSFSMLLKSLSMLLPEDNELPNSMNKAKKTLSTFGMDFEKIHACPNDCVLYRKEHEFASECPTCGTSRYKDNKPTLDRQKRAPAKVLWYFSPIPRFRKMFESKKTSKNLRWHAEREVVKGEMRHPADSPAWKKVEELWPTFADDPRNLRLALSTDGINPHSNLSSKHSCWPVMLINYNLPPWLCMKRKFMMLTMLISGPRQPGNDIDIYLAPLVEDLITLWNEGVDVFDAYEGLPFKVRAMLLWTISDFPAYGNLVGCSVKGYFACPICSENTDSIRLPASLKNVYLSHRKLLHITHRFRKQRKAFNGKQEFGTVPEPLTGREVLEKVKGIYVAWGKPKVQIEKLSKERRKETTKWKGKKTSKKKSSEASGSTKKGTSKRKRKEPSKTKKNVNAGDQSRTCWKKESIFFKLPYWPDLLVRHNLDVMHIEKNVCDSIIGTLLNIPGKTKDGIQSRQDLVEMNMRTELAPEKRGKRTYLPPACYTLSKEEKERVCRTLHELKVPDGYCSNLKHRVSMQDLKVHGLKSHDCHVLMQQLLPVAIRSVLPKHVRYTLTRLCFFFKDICAKIVNVSKLKEIQEDLVLTLCLLEIYFPPSFFDIMVHLTVHLVREVEFCGPVFFRWMYPFERYMRVLKGYVRNRNRPEGCMAENYIAEEAVEFCSEYLAGVDAVGVPISKNSITKENAKDDTILEGRVIGALDVVDVETKLLDKAHHCILENTADVLPYINAHLDELRKKHHKKSPKWLQDEHNRTFVDWFREKVEAEEKITNNNVSEIVGILAQGPCAEVLQCQGFVINGCRFHTKKREATLATQNSGVSVVATGMLLSSAKDKNPVIGDLCYYGVITEIWLLDYLVLKIPLFKCDWVDNKNGVRVDESGFTSVDLARVGYKSEPFILSTQAKQVFYVTDQLDTNWSIALGTPQRDYHEDDDEDEFIDYTKGHKDTYVFPDVDSLDLNDGSQSSYVRNDCEGVYIDDTSDDSDSSADVDSNVDSDSNDLSTTWMT